MYGLFGNTLYEYGHNHHYRTDDTPAYLSVCLADSRAELASLCDFYDYKGICIIELFLPGDDNL
jgi:hypothetical protein